MEGERGLKYVGENKIVSGEVNNLQDIVLVVEIISVVSVVHRSANLILNLFSLMVDANVPDIALEPDKTVKKVRFY